MAAAMVAAQPLRAEVVEKTTKAVGRTVHYKVVLPDGYEPARTYPGILAFGGGPQTMNVVDNLLNRGLRAEAEKRGYIVIAPAAPDGQLFFEGGARIFPAFLDEVLATYRIQGNKFHIAGPSNGASPPFTSRRRIRGTSCPSPRSPDTCGSRALPSCKRSRSSACSCTSASWTNTGGTTR